MALSDRAADLADDLADYLHGVAGLDFGYGRLDCATLMADWLMRRGWPDPMRDRRATYLTERAYRAAIRSEGGLVASCRRRFARIGLCETVSPGPGDIALASAPFAIRRGRVLSRPTGAIVAANGLLAMVRSPRGVVAGKLAVVLAWEVPRA